jgi:3-methylcrotonyl-CoA carboxylase alpha subunit
VAMELPPNVRVDSGIEAGGEVTPFYDPMIAKLIAHAPARADALDRAAAALDHTAIAGVRSNVAFLAALCRAPEFREGRVDTGFIDRNLAALGAVPQPPDNAAAAVGVARLLTGETSDRETTELYSPWDARDGFQLTGTRRIEVPILIGTETAAASVTFGKDGMHVAVGDAAPANDARAFAAGRDVYVLRHGRQTRVRLKDVAVAAADAGGSDGIVKAPMHGKVLELFVGLGDSVTGGQRLAVIEAMKMEHTLRAPFAGMVRQVAAVAGAQVVEGGEIVVIERSEEG